MNKMIKGDTLTVLKTLESNSVDMGVTSPPYNKKKNRKGVLVKDIKYTDIDDSLEEPIYQMNQIEVLDELYRITKSGGSFFYNHKVRWDKGVMIHPMEWLSKTKWAIKQEIIWDRGIAANIRGWRFWQTEERIYWLYKPRDKKDIGNELNSNHALLTSVWKIRPEMRKSTVSGHPAPFPVEIPTRCIYSIMDTNSGCVVIDPYAGSGTTGVVCGVLGHKFIGIDISDEYLVNAKNRILNVSKKEIEDIENEMKLHKVNKTYKQRKDEKRINN